jgi:hypothetical protein
MNMTALKGTPSVFTLDSRPESLGPKARSREKA